MRLKKERVLPIIMSALREDVGKGDITTESVFEKDTDVVAYIEVTQEGIVAGIDVSRWVFNTLDERIVFKPFCEDGDAIKKGKRVVSLKGSVKNILAGERTALNFLGRLSGVATLTNRFVEKVKGLRAEIFDTRKTMPGLRELDKYAIRVGGGKNFRMGLWDGLLVKDNHLDAARWLSQKAKLGVIKDVVERLRKRNYKNVEVEVNNLKECEEALKAGVDIVMLDNMKLEDIKKAVRLRNKRYAGCSILEVSGGVTLENVRRIAKTGVDRISIGSLTHSAPSIDFSLEIAESSGKWGQR